MSELITLHIENLSFEAIIGILDSERLNTQLVTIEAHIDYLYTPKQDYLNYATLCDLIRKNIQTQNYELLESALLDLSGILKDRFPCIQKLTLCIKKPQILAPSIVGASITKDYSRS